MVDGKLKLLREMREIVRVRQTTDTEHPHQTGVKLFGQGKFAEAAEKFREAVKLNPDFSFSYHYLGQALFESGNIDDAHNAFLQAARLNSHYAATYICLGKIETEKGNPAAAEKHYRKTLGLRPDLVEGMFGLVTVLIETRQNDTDELITLLGKIIQTDYTNDAVLSQLINLHPVEADFYINLANELLTDGQTAKALLLYRFAMLAEPELPLAKIKIAGILHNLGKWQDSAEYLETAAALPNQNAESYRLIGDLLAKQKSYTQAIAAYRQVLKFNPDDAETHKKIGDALVTQNRLEDAYAAYSKAVELGYKIY
jgi:tetratricopeptide (TPR) repeat protein